MHLLFVKSAWRLIYFMHNVPIISCIYLEQMFLMLVFYLVMFHLIAYLNKNFLAEAMFWFSKQFLNLYMSNLDSGFLL